MSSDTLGREVAEALLAIDGVGFRLLDPITFKSGIKSPVYCDNRRFPFWPSQWNKVIRGFEQLLQDGGIPVEIIGGVEAAGIPHSAALGFSMQMPSIFIRKEPKDHGTKKRVEGGDVAGRRVVLVEDLITTGSSSMAAIQALRDEGAVVTDCLAIISYGFSEAVELFQENGVRLHTATTFGAVLDVAVGRNLLDADGASVVREWLANPRAWTLK